MTAFASFFHKLYSKYTMNEFFKNILLIKMAYFFLICLNTAALKNIITLENQIKSTSCDQSFIYIYFKYLASEY